MRPLSRGLVSVFVLSLMLSPSAWADPPARVGRLSYLSGTVSFKDASSGEWLPATLNYPVTSGDSLQTEPGSRAEIQVGSSSLSVGANTALDVVVLDDAFFHTRLARGAIIVRVRNLEQGEVYTVDAPGGTISLMRPGRYRIDTDPAGSSATLVVSRGEAQVSVSGSLLAVPEGAAANIANGQTYTYGTANAASDDFDRWALARERSEDQSQSAQYLSPETTGYPDLDRYGHWQRVTDYGPLWFPAAVAPGWAPYRFGYWAWISPWGWTWIDDAPWGFAPFHFGRWVFFNGLWAWSPGVFVTRPVFAPALVAFIGGRHFRIFLSSGVTPLVGWFPLAPGEVFIPSFNCSPLFIRRINAPVVKIVNINVTSIQRGSVNFVNRTIPGAVTVIAQQAFVARRPVSVSVVKVPLNIVTQVPVSGTAVAIVPTIGSVSAPASPPPAAGTSRQQPEPGATPASRSNVRPATPPARHRSRETVRSLSPPAVMPARPAPVFHPSVSLAQERSRTAHTQAPVAATAPPMARGSSAAHSHRWRGMSR